jgi:2-aminoadipate transaminase
MNHEQFLSTAARAFQESAIRKAGALAGRIPDLISFAPGYPDPDLFPWDELKSIADGLLDLRDGNTLQYGATRGYRPLLETLVGHLAERGINTAADQIIVTTGSQQGLDLAGRVLLDPGDVVLVELPTYSGAIAAFQNQQATLLGLPQDAEGLSIGALDEAVVTLRANGRRVRVLYVTPNFQNPTGMLMSQPRRRALLETARRHDLLIIEDDPYGSLYFEDTTAAADTLPIKAEDSEDRVVYLGSVSKTLVPGLRVAWMAAPPAIAARVELAKQAADLCSGVFDQRLVHSAFETGLVGRLAPQLRARYQHKRTVMERALGEAFGGRVNWPQPRGGFFLWVDLGDGVDDRQLFERAVENRVSFVMGNAFFVQPAALSSPAGAAPGPNRYARLAFSFAAPEQIEEGVRRLKGALAAVRAPSGAVHARS